MTAPAQLDVSLALDLYRKMLVIRGVEDRVQTLFLRGEVHGTTHLYSGQEAVAVGVASVLTAGDPNPPTVLEICRAIAAALSHEWAEILIDDPVGEVGSTFWSTPQPVVLDMTEAEFELGYRPLTTYEQAVPETVHWLVDATKERPWQEVMPRAAEYMQDSFDYPAEDDFIRGLVKDD